MELSLNGFENLSELEMIEVDGGSKEASAAVLIIGGACITGIGAPIVCIATGFNPVATVSTVVLGVGMMATGVYTATGVQ